MNTLLGPHLLDNLPLPTERRLLQRWQPPVCLVLINVRQTHLNNGRGLNLMPDGETETESTRLASLVRMAAADLQAHIDIDTATPIKFFRENAQVQHTKVIGRLFLDDSRVRAQIQADPRQAARFHHHLVKTARTKLDGIQSGLADRVQCWVVANEVLATNLDELQKLGEYEKERMKLTEGAGSENTLYGCGLYALANANPPLPGMWRAAGVYGMPAVLAAADTHNRENPTGPQHILLLHQYFQPDRNGVRIEGKGRNEKHFLKRDNQQNNVRRFEHHLYDWFKLTFPNLRVIISEYGLDGRIGLPADQLDASRGWKYFDRWSGTTDSEPGDGAGYLQALKVLERVNRGYRDVVLGYCLFGLGYNNHDPFWSYPLNATPAHASAGQAVENRRRRAALIEDLVDHAEDLRTRTRPAQLRRAPRVTAGLNVRSGPGTNYPVLFMLPGDDSAWHDIVGRSADHIQPGWWQIEVCDIGTAERSQTGWVHGDYVQFPDRIEPTGTPVATVPSPIGSTARVETQAGVVAMVHALPDDGAPIVNTLRGSAAVVGLSRLPTLWYQLQLGDTRRGWVRSSQVKAYHTAKLSGVVPRLRRRPGGTATVPVRNGPGPGDAIVATIAADSTVWYSLRGRDAVYPGWWQIRYSPSVTGWVVADGAVETEGNLNLAPSPRASLAISTQACAVRTKPASTSIEVATIAAGSTTRYVVLGRDAATAAWYRIRYSSSMTGWVPANSVQLHGEGRNLPVIRPLSTADSHPRVRLKRPKAATTVGINVHSKPGSNHRTVVTLPSDSARTYDILGQDAVIADWYQIRVSAVLTGWVSREYVQPHGDLGDIPVR